MFSNLICLKKRLPRKNIAFNLHSIFESDHETFLSKKNLKDEPFISFRFAFVSSHTTIFDQVLKNCDKNSSIRVPIESKNLKKNPSS